MIREAFHSFDYESLNYQDRKDIHDALAETTLKHISGSDGLFTAVPFDVAANPSQRVEHTRLSPAPTTFEEIDILSSVASPRLYPAIKEALDKQKSFVSIAEQRRKEGKHLFSLTTHQQMVDIALYDAAWVGATKHDKWEKDNGNERLKNAIRVVSNKNAQQVYKWGIHNPEYKDSDSKKNDEYMKLINVSMGGSTTEEENRNLDRIAKNVVKEVFIDKNMV